MDAISSLPDCLIDTILARLPLREAVKTSILSREWRYKWTSIPNLAFDFLVVQIFWRDPKYKNAVYQVLRNHRGPINKFSLCWRNSPDIEQWILLLLSLSQLHDFTLCIWGDKYKITSPFFAFQNLKRLHLFRCIFKPPPEFKGFSQLVTLHFEYVEFAPAVFEHFISQNRLLETVRLDSCTEFDVFEVEGLSLRFFTFNGVLKTICFKKTPLLAQVSLSIPTWSSTALNYFKIPPMLEILHLNPCLLEFTDAGGVPSRFAVADCLNSLKVLNLSMYLDSIEEVSCALCLARSSPNLQMLRVTLGVNKTVEAVIEFIRAQNTPDPYMYQLRRVEIELFFGSEPEIELLRYLLASAAGLEKMVITPYPFSLSDDARLMDRVRQLPRASPTALVYVFKTCNSFTKV